MNFASQAYTDDTNDIFTRHKACPVLYGQKWIGNKWVGYNAQWNEQNCKLNPTSPFDPVLYWFSQDFLFLEGCVTSKMKYKYIEHYYNYNL